MRFHRFLTLPAFLAGMICAVSASNVCGGVITDDIGVSMSATTTSMPAPVKESEKSRVELSDDMADGTTACSGESVSSSCPLALSGLSVPLRLNQAITRIDVLTSPRPPTPLPMELLKVPIHG